jgi:hypothetical protein
VCSQEDITLLKLVEWVTHPSSFKILYEREKNPFRASQRLNQTFEALMGSLILHKKCVKNWLINMAAHHWTRVHSLVISHILVPFHIFITPSRYLLICAFLVVGWLNLITHSLICPITLTPNRYLLILCIPSCWLAKPHNSLSYLSHNLDP